MGIGFASWSILSEQSATGEVGADGGSVTLNNFDLSKEIYGSSFYFSPIHATYGYLTDNTFSTSEAELSVTFSMYINDPNRDDDFYNYYTNFLGSPDSFSLYTRLTIGDPNNTGIIDTNIKNFFTVPTTISCTYYTSRNGSHSLGYVDDDASSAVGWDYLDDKMTISPKGAAYGMDTWISIEVNIAYHFSRSSTQTAFTNARTELRASVFKLGIYLNKP